MSFDKFRQSFFHNVETAASQSAWMEKVFRLGVSYLFETPKKKIHSDLTLPQLEKLFSETTIPEKTVSVDAVLKETVHKVIENSVRLNNPLFVGHMTGATTLFSTAIETLTAVLNQNLNKIETALSASFVERQTMTWLHRLVYDRSSDYYRRLMHHPSLLLGTVTSGGTMGNLTALTVARNLAFPSVSIEGWGGVLARASKRRCVIFASRRAHYSIKKVAAILGIGAENVVEIPVEPFTNKVRVDLLKKAIEHQRNKGALLLALVGVAGTTETGSIDDLVSLGSIARDENIWFHVDAAWGGAILLSREHANLLRGIEKADSVVLDGHKFFYLPLDHGAVVFKNEHSLSSIRHHAHYIIREGSVDLGQMSLEGSRRFNSLKLWFALKTLGKEGYARLIEHSFDLAQVARREIEAHPNFELTSAVETNILTYRFIPEQWKQPLARLRAEILSFTKVKKMTAAQKRTFIKVTRAAEIANSILNRVNIDLQKNQRQVGKSFVSRTTLESVLPGSECVVLRMIPFNPFTTKENLREILFEQKQLGKKAMRREWAQSATKVARLDKDFFPPF